MAQTELLKTYELKKRGNPNKLDDYIEKPIRTTFDKSFVIKTVCLLAPPNACKRVQIALQGGEKIIIDDVQYAAIFS